MLPVAFLDQEATPGGLRVWRLRVTGPPRRKERRQFVRVPWSLPTRLEIPHDPASLGPQMRRLVDRFGLQADLAQLPTLIEGIAVNVSEGGLLCLSPKPVLPANLPLTVRFTIESACFEVGCSVVWSLARERDTANEPGLLTVESALVFLDPRRYGEVLRPLLFQAQLRGRRAALR